MIQADHRGGFGAEWFVIAVGTSVTAAAATLLGSTAGVTSIGTTLLAFHLAAAARLLVRPGAPAQVGARPTVDRTALVPVVVQAALVLVLVNGFATARSPLVVAIAAGGALVLALLCLDTLRAEPIGDRSWAWLAGIAGAVMLVATTWNWDLLVDVELFQDVASRVLLDGADPYAGGIFTNPYDELGSALFYGPGVVQGDVLSFGFPYLPVALLAAVPFHLLGDVRLLPSVATIGGALLLWLLARRSRQGRWASLALLSSPLAASMVVGAWNDGLVALLLLGVALAWDRERPLTADVLLGLAVATKQYAVLFVPLYLVLAARHRRTHLFAPVVPIGVSAGLVTLPFLLRNPGGFVYSVVELHLIQPFRPDSLSLLFGFGMPPAWTGSLGLVAAIVVGAWVLQRVHHDAHGLLVSWALVMFAFVMLSKQAFGNYYLLVFVLMLGAAATAPWRGVPEAAGEEPARGETPADGASPAVGVA